VKVGLAAATLAVAIVTMIPLYVYAIHQPTYDWMVFVLGVAVPGLFGAAVFMALGSRTLLMLFLAYLFSVTDDAPINLDSIYTWPEVTSGLHHDISEVVLHLATLALMLATTKGSLNALRRPAQLRRLSLAYALTLAAFAAASVSVVPIASLQQMIRADWLPVDFAGHLASLVFMAAALLSARWLYRRNEDVGINDEERTGAPF